jgi:hypothetical protein
MTTSTFFKKREQRDNNTAGADARRRSHLSGFRRQTAFTGR